MIGVCSAYGGEERRIQGLVGKPVRKRPLGRPRRRWEDNIKMDLQEVGCGEMNGSSWLSKGTGGGTCECRNEPSAFIKYGEFLV